MKDVIFTVEVHGQCELRCTCDSLSECVKDGETKVKEVTESECRK